MKKCTGCDRLENVPLGLNNKGDKYLACCPDNNYIEMTAVEWLVENLISEPYSEADFEHNKKCWDKAEEMETQQIIDSFNKGFITDQWDKSKENKAKQYYNETYKNTKK